MPNGYSSDRRLTGLDALRGIAALCVVAMHVHAIFPDVTREWMSSAYLAVDFFFVLSGFVMARTYEARLARGPEAGGLGAVAFFKLRLRRLWPTMAVGFLLSAPLIYMRQSDPRILTAILIPNLLMLPSFAEDECFPLNVPGWSVFFELLANLAHGLVLWRWNMRALSLLAALFLALLVLCGLHWGSLDIGGRPANLVGGIARVGFAYTVGMMLWRGWKDRPALYIPPALSLLAMPVLFIAPSRLGFAGWKFDLAFVALVCPLLLCGGLCFPSSPSTPAGRLASYAGALSFPLYAVHFPILLWAKHFELPPLAGFMLSLAGGMALAAWQNRHQARPTRIFTV